MEFRLDDYIIVGLITNLCASDWVPRALATRERIRRHIDYKCVAYVFSSAGVPRCLWVAYVQLICSSTETEV